MSVEETSKRALSASAPENDPKRLKEDATAPAWAVNLFSTMKNELKNDLTSVIDERMSRLEIINEQVNERCDDMEVKIDKNADDIAKLFAENKQLKEALAKCNDTNMRNSLTICGVKRAQGEKFWSHTREALAVALEKMTPLRTTTLTGTRPSRGLTEVDLNLVRPQLFMCACILGRIGSY